MFNYTVWYVIKAIVVLICDNSYQGGRTARYACAMTLCGGNTPPEMDLSEEMPLYLLVLESVFKVTLRSGQTMWNTTPLFKPYVEIASQLC